MTERQNTMNEPKYHPACLLLPEMSAEEYRDLVEDIAEHGQREPILADGDDLILDGRHRERACRELGIVPKFERFTGSEAAKVAVVVSRNIHRRHLTTQQRAAIAAELATMRSGARTDLASIDARSQLSDAQAAKLMKVSEPSVERAKRRMRTDPEAHAKAKAGMLGRRKRKDRTIDGDRLPEPKRQPEPKRERIEGVDFEYREDRYGYIHREPITSPDVDAITALKAAWLNATSEQRREFLEWTGAIAHQREPKQMDIEDAIADQPAELDTTTASNSYAERGARIRAARIAKGLNAKQLAKIAGIAPNYVSMAEHARLTKSGGPAAGRPTFVKLEAALDLTARGVRIEAK